MVENVAEDGVEVKPGKNKATGVGVGSSEGKPTNDVKFKVKILFQVEAHIVHNQAKPVPTGNFEEKPKPVPTGVRVIQVNTGSFFTTNERWKDREELLGWIHRQAARAGFTISTDKSSTIVSYMTMQCERSGEYKPPKTRKKLKFEGTGSRKCNCLFKLKCFFEKKTQEWWIAMFCGVHNHDLASNLSGQLLAGRLKGEEKQRVIDMTKSLAKPRNILTDLKERNKESVTLIKQVYNARARWRKGQREDKTELQYLITSITVSKLIQNLRNNSNLKTRSTMSSTRVFKSI
ncbi:FAR1 DNA-binding domain protein [Medicago truncatula]|uniref:FAR1 DNA-binding domain protein n=1 Tax=Medicago truncatula TaxID=3880 RepID=A0A072V007_MEDTR|nr:FAR1 DNA-binding domain protein [Medicago truncatula]